jgi:hypothetical protein
VRGVVGAALIPEDDHQIGDLLVKAASGLDVETDRIDLLRSREAR